MCVAPKYGEKLIQTFHKESFRCVNINLLLEQEPSEENRVVLNDNKDKYGIPKIKLFYKRSTKPLKTCQSIFRRICKLLYRKRSRQNSY